MTRDIRCTTAPCSRRHVLLRFTGVGVISAVGSDRSFDDHVSQTCWGAQAAGAHLLLYRCS
uniref:Uncharacterized protein n=1 Tax=Hyaloperonospora arabidopsidis (strain Emoy2) TaxID=559515 RepID=M4BLG6_HYAAE